MATYTTTSSGWYAANNATNFNSVVTAIYNCFTNCGWLQASDTGQLNVASLSTSYSTSTNGVNGYLIFKMNDALQATKPFFIRIEFCYDGSGGLYLTISCGSGTNGSGTLTGLVSNRFSWFPYSYAYGNTITTFNWAASGDGSYLAMQMAVLSGGAIGLPPLLVIDRSRTATGTASGDGVLVLLVNGQSNQGVTTGYAASASLSYPTNGATHCNHWVWGWPFAATATGNTSGVVSNNVEVIGSIGGLYPNFFPTHAIYPVFQADWPSTTSFSMTALGSAHTYRVVEYGSGYSYHSQLQQGLATYVSAAYPASQTPNNNSVYPMYALRYE